MQRRSGRLPAGAAAAAAANAAVVVVGAPTVAVFDYGNFSDCAIEKCAKLAVSRPRPPREQRMDLASEREKGNETKLKPEQFPSFPLLAASCSLPGLALHFCARFSSLRFSFPLLCSHSLLLFGSTGRGTNERTNKQQAELCIARDAKSPKGCFSGCCCC